MLFLIENITLLHLDSNMTSKFIFVLFYLCTFNIVRLSMLNNQSGISAASTVDHREVPPNT